MSKLCYSKWSCRVTKKDCIENCIENSVISSCHREWLCRRLNSQITVCIQRTASFLWKPQTRNVQQRQLRIKVFTNCMRPNAPAVALFRKHIDKMQLIGPNRIVYACFVHLSQNIYWSGLGVLLICNCCISLWCEESQLHSNRWVYPCPCQKISIWSNFE